ncbi:hypothetical protein E2A64_06365 [Pseudohoeflea suaedae]|uniref:Uncharacterized protein n=1 Tax=Pseudohoeflea suaedae TaxID=877384 RepID=A0A4R5PP69_9HYPH|nr:hypothetical protein [Pseudohoeflea suaedae]TDH38718.1 hypothetical protein E2A64_06365 [Pseudohoeflea suaedae]
MQDVTHDIAPATGATPFPHLTGRAPSMGRIRNVIGETTLGRADFVTTVQAAAHELGAEYLFELPASGLALDCERIAMLRMKTEGKDDIFLLVKLGMDGRTLTVAEPEENTKGVTDFARAFVNVLTRL